MIKTSSRGLVYHAVEVAKAVEKHSIVTLFDGLGTFHLRALTYLRAFETCNADVSLPSSIAA